MHKVIMAQMELRMDRPREPDRNRDKGGRSFYFFDLDDNVLFLSTPIYLFHKEKGHEIVLSTSQFALHEKWIGKSGPYLDYELRFDDAKGSYRRFRDFESTLAFIEDLRGLFEKDQKIWQGPSWSCFYHAAHNQRPTSVITARGHHPNTIQRGIDILVEEGHLSHSPNYLAIYPVSHVETRKSLGDDLCKESVSELKRRAIFKAVEKSFEVYGTNPHHRFGMSDDSPDNLHLITDAFRTLKRTYPENSFFVIDTHQERFVKQEIFDTYSSSQKVTKEDFQLDLF